MHVHGALLDVHTAAPHVIEQLAARVDALGMGHAEMQPPIFGRSDVHGLGAAKYSVRRTVDAQVAQFDKAVRILTLAAPHDCANPREQFTRRKRLDRVIIHACIEAADAVAFPHRAQSA